MNFSPLAPELEQLIATLFAESKCFCHVINPHKTRILMWKEAKADQVIYHLRIGIQKFIAQEQIDRNGEVYWRYYAPEIKKEETTIKEKEGVRSELAQKQTELDPITKFQQRQAKTQTINHDEPTQPVKQSTNN